MKVSELTNPPKRRFKRSLLVALLITFDVDWTQASLLVLLLVLIGLLDQLTGRAGLERLARPFGVEGSPFFYRAEGTCCKKSAGSKRLMPQDLKPLAMFWGCHSLHKNFSHNSTTLPLHSLCRCLSKRVKPLFRALLSLVRSNNATCVN